MPEPSLTSPVSFDDAVGRLMNTGMTRGQAIGVLQQHFTAGTPSVLRIPDIEYALERERVKGEMTNFFQRFASMATAPVRTPIHAAAAFGFAPAQVVENAIGTAPEQRYEASPGAAMAGGIAGGLAGGVEAAE